jgi:hypothetical protein
MVRPGLPLERAALAGWAVAGALGGAALLALAASGVPVTLSSGWRIGAAILILGTIAVVYRFLRPSPRLSLGAEASVQLICILLSAGLLVQAGAVIGAGIPYADAFLWQADQALLFDWVALDSWVDAHATVSLILEWAYFSIGWQLAGVVVALAATRRELRLRRFVVATGLTLAATCAIFPFVPALGYDGFLGLGQGEPELRLEALRAGLVDAIRLDELVGIVTFPSFHTAAALLLAWAFWGLGRLRWPGVALNAAMLAATPFHGSHYLVDLIAGAVIAGLAIIASGRAAGPAGAARPVAIAGGYSPSREENAGKA